MWKIGIIVVAFVYVIVALCTFFAIKLVKGIVNDTSSIAIKRTIHVVLLLLGIYFIPLTVLSICIVCYPKFIGFLIMAIMLSAFPVTEHIIIPLSHKKYIKLKEKELYK